MQHRAAFCRLALVIALAGSGPRVCYAEQVRNLLANGDFETAAAEVPTAWRAASRPVDGLRMWRDTEHAHGGKACLAISNDHDYGPNASNNWTRKHYGQKVSNNWNQKPTDIPAGRTIRLTGYIRTEDAESANICVQCWDADDKMVAYTSTPVFRGTHDWTFAEAAEIAVPPQTKTVTVRAALTGKGKAFFDDLMLEVFDARAADDQAELQIVSRSPRLPSNAPLEMQVVGRIVRTLPIVEDSMVLSYLPEWNHGTVDNIGLANYDGGVRMLLKWESPSAQALAQNGLRFVLALYARDAKASTRERVVLSPLEKEWQETVSWSTQPDFDKRLTMSMDLPSGKGWKLFDVTRLVQLTIGKPNLGFVLRFETEDRTEGDEHSCEYQFVSREGLGEWVNRRPVLLVIDPTPPASAPADVATVSGPSVKPEAPR